jgi:hypothetical protein
MFAALVLPGPAFSFFEDNRGGLNSLVFDSLTIIFESVESVENAGMSDPRLASRACCSEVRFYG